MSAPLAPRLVCEFAFEGRDYRLVSKGTRDRTVSVIEEHDGADALNVDRWVRAELHEEGGSGCAPVVEDIPGFVAQAVAGALAGLAATASASYRRRLVEGQRASGGA